MNKSSICGKTAMEVVMSRARAVRKVCESHLYATIRVLVFSEGGYTGPPRAGYPGSGLEGAFATLIANGHAAKHPSRAHALSSHLVGALQRVSGARESIKLGTPFMLVDMDDVGTRQEDVENIFAEATGKKVYAREIWFDRRDVAPKKARGKATQKKGAADALKGSYLADMGTECPGKLALHVKVSDILDNINGDREPEVVKAHFASAPMPRMILFTGLSAFTERAARKVMRGCRTAILYRVE